MSNQPVHGIVLAHGDMARGLIDAVRHIAGVTGDCLTPLTNRGLGPEALAQDLCWLLSRASHSLGTEMSAALEAIDLTPRAFHVLRTAVSDEHTQIELARIIGLDKTTMVVTLDELEQAGLAERRPSPEDRRVRVIAVTAAGKRKARKAEEILARVREDVLHSLPAGDRKAFVESLRKLACDRLAEPVECAHPLRRRSPG